MTAPMAEAESAVTNPGTSACEEPRGALFTWPVRVYWEDTDAGGIVYYANYLKFFERARTEWLRALGLEQQALRVQTGAMFVVSEAQVKYLLPARLDDQLLVTAKILEMGRSSFTMEQQALRLATADNGNKQELLCAASVRIGWVNGASLKPARIPNQLLQALQT
ncbi:MAG: tol-pal system-associated acyl-CoA thioesterase [Betaproteobacteria bacterium]